MCRNVQCKAEHIFVWFYAGYGINVTGVNGREIILLFSMCRHAHSYAFISVIELSRIHTYCPKLHPVPVQCLRSDHFYLPVRRKYGSIPPEYRLWSAVRLSSACVWRLPDSGNRYVHLLRVSIAASFRFFINFSAASLPPFVQMKQRRIRRLADIFLGFHSTC